MCIGLGIGAEISVNRDNKLADKIDSPQKQKDYIEVTNKRPIKKGHFTFE